MSVFERARAAGIHTEYIDAKGEHHAASETVLTTVLAAFPAQLVDSPASASGGDSRVAYADGFDRVCLLACQLYGLRSARNWGIGDFSDLKVLIGMAADWGCAGVGLNPLHALFEDRPAECSPYAPNSRLFLNAVYIDWNSVPDLPDDFCDGHAAKLRAARDAALVDYVIVGALKTAAARVAFDRFRKHATPERRAAFGEFRARGGKVLEQFACFEALRRQAATPWWEWSDAQRTPSNSLVDELLAAGHGEAMDFVVYVQWIADQQLAACAAHAKRVGMRIGLYLDVAVGVQAGGFDAWSEPTAIARSLSVGAPPDILNTAGQNWGLSGFSAAGLRQRDYEPLHAILDSAMRHSGAIRLDHVLGLRRLYLIPHGVGAADGVYVDMPFDAMADTIADASQAHKCVVIGEDLGTVPDGFRDDLKRRNIFSYSVMMFERRHDGFIALRDYPSNALVTFNTHDLATFEGWRTLSDMDAKRHLGIDPGEADHDRHAAIADLARMLGYGDAQQLTFIDVIAALAQAPSRILAVAIEDLLELKDQPNIPGTIDEHPNWRRKLPVSVEDFASSIDVDAFRAAIACRI